MAVFNTSLVFLIIIFMFSDSPEEVANGRSLIFFAIPIVTASVLIRPISSFAFAFLSGIAIVFLSQTEGLTLNPTALGGFFMLALISWLSSRNLDTALKELRDVNSNLDQIAQERTQALAQSLQRERIEAGRNQAVLEGITDGVIVFDTKGDIIQANPAISLLLDIPSDELDGATVQSLLSNVKLDANARDALENILIDFDNEIKNHRISWGKKELLASVSEVHDLDGDMIGNVAVLRDFTKEAQVEKMKSTFLAIVSHELRTPLNAILGFAEMIKEEVYGSVTEKQKAASVRIMTNARRLLSIVSDLLDQSQIEAGRLTIQIHPFRPQELISNIHDVLDKLASDKGVVFSSEIDPDIPDMLNGDSSRLQQIIINLVANAIKFTDQGSVHLRLFEPDVNHWAISVKDSGLGIPKDEIGHIFEAFRQVDAAMTREHGGFGLGLSIVKNLVDLMGGRIDVESQLGIGSIFIVTFPLVSRMVEEK